MRTEVTQRKKVILIILCICALLIAAAFPILYGQHTLTAEEWNELKQTGTFCEGIRVDGISLGEMTYAQGDAAVRQVLEEAKDAIQIELTYKGRTFMLTQGDFSIADNVESVLVAAMKAAREGSLVSMKNEAAQIKKQGRSFTTAISIDPASVYPRLQEIADELNIPAQDAKVRVSKTAGSRFIYTAEADGMEVDMAQLYSRVSQMVQTKAFGSIEIPVNRLEPAVTAAMLKEKTVKLAASSTSFANAPYNRADRVENIRKAAGLINGYVLRPGAQFSANAVMGPRTYKLGWKPSPAIVGGKMEDQAGGGVCQVATTMYNAVLKADLPIVSRRPHSIHVLYVDGGLDATVNTGSIDFIFKNTTDDPVYIFSWVNDSNKTINFEIYGSKAPSNYDEIRLLSKKLKTLVPGKAMKVTVDKSMSPGSGKVVVQRRNGAIYEAFKVYYKNGKEVQRVSIGTSTYKAYAGEKLVGPSRPLE